MIPIVVYNCLDSIVYAHSAVEVGHPDIIFDGIFGNFIKRKLPVCCLSQGGFDLANKAWVAQHQTWLEYGGSIQATRCANADVRGILTDLGTEVGIGDFWDFVKYYTESLSVGPDYECEQPDSTADADPLYPLAIKICGPLHCIDWIVRKALELFPKFDEFLEHLKALCQFLHSRNHRAFMERKVDKHPSASDEAKAASKKSLQQGCTRFAAWRWTSIHQADKDLIKQEDAIHLSVAKDEDFKKWGIVKCTKSLNSLRYAVSTPDLWDTCRAVEFCIGPLMTLHGWIKGCDCHSAEEHQPKGKLKCPKSGLRAKTIAARVDQCIDEYEHLRDELPADKFGAIAHADIHSVIGFIIAMLVLKLRTWLNTIPYLIWQDVFLI